MGITIPPNTSNNDNSPSPQSKFLLYTDYNYINIDLLKSIPEKSIINRDKVEKQRNSEWIKKVGNYHKELMNEYYKGEKSEAFYGSIGMSKDEEKAPRIDNYNFSINSRFSSILSMKYLTPEKEGRNSLRNRLLVIENDWNKIMKTLPDAIVKSSYKV